MFTTLRPSRAFCSFYHNIDPADFNFVKEKAAFIGQPFCMAINCNVLYNMQQEIKMPLYNMASVYKLPLLPVMSAAKTAAWLATHFSRLFLLGRSSGPHNIPVCIEHLRRHLAPRQQPLHLLKQFRGTLAAL